MAQNRKKIQCQLSQCLQRWSQAAASTCYMMVLFVQPAAAADTIWSRFSTIMADVYGELVGRCIQYHLSNGSVITGMSLRGSFQNAVEPLLAHRRFVLCSISFFVNLSYVEMIDSSNIRLTGDKTLPVSRSHRAEVTRRWLDFHLEGDT